MDNKVINLLTNPRDSPSSGLSVGGEEVVVVGS